MQQTNLLILMDDEHSSKALGCYGHPFVKTPNLDRLAENGTLFERAYTNSPICVPARATIATGRHVHENRCWDNAIAYDGQMRSWTHRMQETGHRVVSVGKLHYRNADNPAGFDRQIVPMHITDGRGDTLGLVRDAVGVAPDVEDCGLPGASLLPIARPAGSDRACSAEPVSCRRRH